PIPRRAKNPHRPSRLRRRGTWAAALLALASGGVLTTLMVRSALEEVDGPRGRDGDPGSDILTGGTDGPARPGGPPDLAGAMENARLDLLDREDRTRKIGELFLVRTEPVAERRYHIDEPSALLFLDDGRTVHVRADSGEMYIPETTGQPESGRVEGNVVVRLFPAREDGRAIDPDVDEPSGVLRTQVLIFDRTLGELRAPGPVTVTSPLLDGRV